MKAASFAALLLRNVATGTLSITEQRILIQLTNGPAKMAEIAADLDLPSSTIQQLNYRLRNLGYIDRTKDGKYSIYSLTTYGEKHIRTLLSFLAS